MLRNKPIIILLVILLAISIIRYIVSMDTPLDKENITYTIVTVFIAFIILLSQNRTQGTNERNYLKIGYVFCISFIIVHFFEYLAFILDVKQVLISSQSYQTSHVNESSILALCSFLAFGIGYVTEIRSKKKVRDLSSSLNLRLLDFLMPISLYLFYFFADKQYFEAGGNFYITNNGGLSPLASMFQATFLGAQGCYSIIQIIRGKKISFFKYITSFSILYYFSLFTYTYLVLSSGDRGPILYVSFSFVLPYFVLNRKKLNLKTAVFGVVFGALALNFLGILRNVSGELSYDKIGETNAEMAEKYEESNAFFLTTEQLSVVVRAYNVVYDFTKDNGTVIGLGFLNNLSGVVPGLRSYFIYPLLGIEGEGINMLSTDYLSTFLLNSDHGMGTTCVGDTYFNFGFTGCIIAFLLFGLLCKYLDDRLYDITSCPIFVYILAFWYLIFSIYIGRSTLISPISYCGYTYFIYLVVKFFSPKGKIFDRKSSKMLKQIES